jgi:hypothetical protein
MTIIEPPLPTRNCTHQPLPFIQTAAKAQFAGCVETQSSVHLASLSAFCVVGVPIMAPGSRHALGSETILFLS